METLNIITTNQIAEACKIAWGRNRVPFLRGAPGIGKTESVLAVVRERAGNRPIVNSATPKKDEFGFIDLRLSLYETVDVGGLPYIETVDGVKVQRRAMFDLLPRSGEGVLMIDELPQAPVSMQCIIGQLFTEGRIGEYIFPSGWKIVCAGNRREDRSGSNDVLLHLLNRTFPYTIIASADAWLNWAGANGVATEVCAFIKFQSHLLHKMPEQRAGNVPFPSPRQWVVVSGVLQDGLMSASMEGPTFAALVGDEAGAGFQAFLATYRTLPDLDKALQNPDSAATPMGLAPQFAALASITRKVCNKPALFGNAMRYIGRFDSPEYAVVLVRLVKGNAKAFDAIKDTPEYGGFIARNKDLFVGA